MLMSSPTSRPYIDENGLTDAEKYLQGCLDGTYVVGHHIKQLAEMMLPQIRDGFRMWHWDPEKATRPVRFIEKFCRIPSAEKMGQPFILEPYERMIIELAFGFVDDEGYRRFSEVIVEVGRKNGKGVQLSEELPTPYGWRKMGDLHVGDVVFGQDGKPSTIVAESEIFDKPTYMVTFEDGSHFKVTDDHIWTVYDSHLHKRDMTTVEILSEMGDNEFSVPLCKPVEYPHADLRRDPYDVGFSLVGSNDGVDDKYLMSSPRQRLMVVHGIEDACRTYGLMNPVFGLRETAESVCELFASVGRFARVFESDGTYGVDALSCDTLMKSRKAVVSIKRIPNEPTKCIAIDSPSHLYLVGRQYTATHNTSMLAALNLYMLCGDGELAAECYNGATSTNQASLCYGSTQDMKEMSPVLDKNIRYGKIKKRKQMGLNYDKTRSYLCTISGRHKSLDGLNVHFGVLDELAAFTDNGAAYRLLKGSMGSRRQPMLMIISTSNFVRFGIWDKRLAYSKRLLAGEVDDPRLLPILYELDDETEVYDEAMWPKANPGLGTVKSWDYLRDAVNTAKQDPSELPELLSKQFNLPANQEAAFFTYDEACNPAKFEFDSNDFKYCVVGIDAADSIDLNCATALFMKKDDPHIYRRSMYWIAEEQVKINIAKDGRDHGAPYHEWAAEGYIRIVDGNKVDRRVFLEWIQELYEEGLYCRAIAHDRYGMKEIERQLDEMVGKANVHALAYGPKTLSDPMKKLRVDMRDGLIVDNDNPIDHWCNLNVSVVRDTGGGIKPVKKDGPGDRIDGFSALVMAYTVLQENMDDYQALIS